MKLYVKARVADMLWRLLGSRLFTRHTRQTTFKWFVNRGWFNVI